MTNTFSPAHDYYLADASGSRPAPRVRYPSPSAGLRLLRWQLKVLWAVAPGRAFRTAWKVVLHAPPTARKTVGGARTGRCPAAHRGG